MGSITDRALDAMPGYRENALVRVLKAERYKNRASALSVNDDVRQLIIDLARDDEQIPFDVAAPIVDAERQQRLWHARENAIDEAISSLETNGTDVLRQHSQRALAVLNEELLRLVAEVKGMESALAGASTAENAIRGGKDAVAAYQRVSELVADYDEIRTAQARILRDYDKGENLHLHSMMHYGLHADSIEALPFWGTRRVDAFDASTLRGPDVQGYLEWFERGRQPIRQFTWDQAQRLERSWWPSEDPTERIAHLIWMATETTPWVPSVKYMRAANMLAAEATLPLTSGARTVNFPDVVRALGALCELTGTPWPSGVPGPRSDQQLKAHRNGNDNGTAAKHDNAVYLAHRLETLY